MLVERICLDRFLEGINSQQCLSDIHLIPDAPAIGRIGGRLRKLGISASEVNAIINEAVDSLSEDERMTLMGRGDVTVRSDHDKLLVRLHFYRERGRSAIAIRLLQTDPPRLAQLGLPDAIGDFAKASSGLVLLTGPVSSGKSSALAALVRRMDELCFERHVRIIESPIEWVHHPDHLIVTHVSLETRADAPTASAALASALRSDAQVIVFGELLDEETTVAAVEAAYGAAALVIVTMHAPSLSAALSAIVSAFPPDAERRLRKTLAEVFVGGAALRLLPRVDAVGRIPACELVFANDMLRSAIRGGSLDIRAVIEAGRDQGMQTLEADLSQLISKGYIDPADARVAAPRPELLGV